jgi:aerobic carbon-monoxide dehydrogenase large subunit
MTSFGLGQSVRRVEDRRFLTGRGRFVDDINLPHQCHGVVVLSPYPHARIVSIDTDDAKAAPSVLCVLTGADAIADRLGGLPPLFMPDDFGGSPAYRTTRPILVSDRVRCVGDRVAFVVAETVAQAYDAADLIKIEYDPLPVVSDLAAAVEDGAPRIWDECKTGNVCFEICYGDRVATDSAFAMARHKVALRLESSCITANALEPRAAIGVYEFADGRFTLYASSQNPHGLRSAIARHVLHIPESKIRVIAPDVGGGFGLKSNAHVEDALVLWAARRCGRPVKWTPTRSETMVSDYQGRGQVVHGQLAFDDNGKIHGIRARALHGVGAYTSAVCAAPIIFSLQYIPNVYDVQAIDLRSRAVFTNTAALTAYRGTGRPEAIYLVERLLDEVAFVLGIDPAEIRRRNLIPLAAVPYRTATGVIYDSGDFARVLEKCLRLADWAGFAARRTASENRGRLRGRGISYYIETAGHDNERMELRFDPGGSITIVAGTHSHGQGHATTYAQMVSDWLGVPFADIRVLQGDTDKIPFGRGTYGARSSMNGGCALKAAADALIKKASLMAAALMEADARDIQFTAGRFQITGTDRVLSLSDVAKAFYFPGGITDKFGVGLEASGSYGTNPPNHPNGCHVCEVEVDRETGEAVLVQYTVVDDVGRVINPMICEGQVHGGLAQGIGQAMMEQIVYDHESGQNLSASFMDYAMPRARDVPNFAIAFEEVPCTTNPLGVKGIGEAGAIGAPPAVLNAIIDALRPLGVWHIDMPATSQRIWDAIARAHQAKRA